MITLQRCNNLKAYHVIACHLGEGTKQRFAYVQRNGAIQSRKILWRNCLKNGRVTIFRSKKLVADFQFIRHFLILDKTNITSGIKRKQRLHVSI